MSGFVPVPAPSREFDQPLQVVDNAVRDRFELWSGDTFIGLVGYEMRPAVSVEDTPVLLLLHTVINEEFGQSGLARALLTEIMEDTRRRGLHVHPMCTYARSYLGRYPQYADLIDTSQNLGAISQMVG